MPSFEWDPAKDEANRLKHRVSFVEAALALDGPHLSRRDDRRDYGERRWIALGRTPDGIVLNVVYTRRGTTFRIISAWKAGRRERDVYEAARRRGAI